MGCLWWVKSLFWVQGSIYIFQIQIQNVIALLYAILCYIRLSNIDLLTHCGLVTPYGHIDHCCQARSHYLSQCLPRSLSPYGITRLQWVKHYPLSWNHSLNDRVYYLTAITCNIIACTETEFLRVHCTEPYKGLLKMYSRYYKLLPNL